MLRSRHGKWHFRFWINGKEHSGSTNLPADEKHKPEAEARAEAVRFTCRGSAANRKPRDVAFTRAVGAFLAWAEGEYKAACSYKRLAASAASLGKLFGGLKVREIGAAELEQFKTFRRAAGLKEVTIRHDLHALSVFFQFAMRMKWADSNPVREVEIPSDKDAVRERVLTAEEEAVYFSEASKHPLLGDLGRLILLTGIRPDEALRMKAADFDRHARTIRIAKGKTRSAKRTLLLVPEAFAVVERRAARGGYLFPGKRAGTHLTNPYRAHAKICAAAGVRFVIYSLRHTFATRLAERGVPLPTLAALLGHASLRCVHRYVHPSQAAMDAAILAIQAER